jgi:hypothetical protein
MTEWEIDVAIGREGVLRGFWESLDENVKKVVFGGKTGWISFGSNTRIAASPLNGNAV